MIASFLIKKKSRHYFRLSVTLIDDSLVRVFPGIGMRPRRSIYRDRSMAGPASDALFGICSAVLFSKLIYLTFTP